MKSIFLKMAISTIAGSVAAYFNALLVPIVLLAVVMIMDYASGIASAWKEGKINSRIGVIGIVKKVCYLLAVGAAIILDLIIAEAFTKIGVEFTSTYIFGVIVIVWFVINELISILENVNKIGVPLPSFFLKVVKRLKDTVEHTGESTTNTNEKEQ